MRLAPKPLHHYLVNSINDNSKLMITAIESGKYRGHSITTLSGQQTRPTLSRIRKSLCDIIMHASFIPSLSNIICADIFAGSGAVGISFLSHGVKKCFFYESHREAYEILQQNLTNIDNAYAFCDDVFKSNPCELCDMIFIDPPYHYYQDNSWFNNRFLANWLGEKGIVIMQMPSHYYRNFDAGCEKNNMTLLNKREYGKTIIAFYQFTAKIPS